MGITSDVNIHLGQKKGVCTSASGEADQQLDSRRALLTWQSSEAFS